MADNNPRLGGSASSEGRRTDKIGQKQERDAPRDRSEMSCSEQRI